MDGTSGGPSGGTDLERFHALVLADADLFGRLLGSGGRAEFTARVCRLAAERGLTVSPAEVDAALSAARRSWLERWV